MISQLELLNYLYLRKLVFENINFSESSGHVFLRFWPRCLQLLLSLSDRGGIVIDYKHKKRLCMLALKPLLLNNYRCRFSYYASDYLGPNQPNPSRRGSLE